MSQTSPLHDKDRIFTNLYGYQSAGLKAAQARGDFQVLAERNRRVLRVHLKGELGHALGELEASVARAL